MTALDVTRASLEDALRAVGIERGDTVYVAASLAALGRMDDPAADVLGALRAVVGDAGTLVMPTFNFGFCRGESFDPRHTPSECGVLSEAFRAQPGVRRTVAPAFHTVAAWGAAADEIGAIESLTSFGPDSVFEHLVARDARHLLIGCGFHEGVAHFHWLEERMEAPYRYWKRFEGDVVIDGRATRRAYFMYARRAGVELDADPLGAEFEADGFVRRCDVGLCRIRAFGLADFARFMRPRFARDPRVLVRSRGAGAGAAGSPRCPVRGVAHLGIASRYADAIRAFLGSIGCERSHEGAVESIGVRCEYWRGLGTTVELVDPVRPESAVSGFVRRHADSPLHHVALEVDALEPAVRFFRSKGYDLLDGRVMHGPRPGERVVFLSPVQTGGLLVELVALDGPTDGRCDEVNGWQTRAFASA